MDSFPDLTTAHVTVNVPSILQGQLNVWRIDYQSVFSSTLRLSLIVVDSPRSSDTISVGTMTPPQRPKISKLSSNAGTPIRNRSSDAACEAHYLSGECQWKFAYAENDSRYLFQNDHVPRDSEGSET